ncbi:hypothetical protein [Nocardioides marmorisolisilvae]|uniref:Uncharacterized protein n=1 Tax=Nocardioides marmorisolisilvae TaxID=1542737 RepID=A0A3N0DW59_9ACTN|nr:hypothetical protein [Nocardioides marmorisolisilvae]RNL79847.1 hypothetical protein EFL95_12945 [Nocardioides marmorisolisilvae]
MALLSSTTARLRSGHAATALVLLTTLLGLATFLVPENSVAAPAATSSRLVGTLQLTPGSCSGGKASGTYFRMILPSGHAGGPYLSNSDSRCSDQTVTPLSPGSDGGLRVGSYQPSASPRFTANGDATARRITAPAAFYGTSFATATSPVDPQTKRSVPAPQISVSGSRLTADLRSFGVTWNNQDFNQGAPKPDGSTPGNTAVGTGTYDASTGAFSLTWSSQIVGGPFDKFTGSWHFEGRFVPAAGSGSSGSTGTTGSGGSTGGTTTTPSSSGGGSAPGTTTSTSKPTSAGKPATGEGLPGAAPVVDTRSTAPVTKVVTSDRWHVSWPVVGLAFGIGLLAVGALVLSTVLTRRAETA